MANSKRKCRACPDRKRPEDMLIINGVHYCDEKCMLEYVRRPKVKAKAKKKANAEIKSNFYANDLKTRKASAKKACHDYIRARDKGKLCPCCNEPLGDVFHAGHFLESGNNPLIRYDEDNVHGQRVYCNTYRGGNPVGYEKGLRDRIGDERVDRLLSMKGKSIKRTAEDYKQIEDTYKKKLDMLKCK